MADSTKTGPAIYTWINNVTDATAVYEGIAPQGTEFPYITYDAVSPAELNLTKHRMLDELWQIKAISDVRADAALIAHQVEVRMIQSEMAVEGWEQYWISRETGISYPEVDDDGQVIYHVGATYRIRLAEQRS